MFNNLIESSSHTHEFKRRGSFVLFTAATYFLLFVIAGVVSIYAYDARLEDPNTEIVVMLPPVDLAVPQPAAPVRNSTPSRGRDNNQNIPVRQNPTASVNVPQAVPEKPSANPNPFLPIPDRGLWSRGERDFDPGQSVGSGPGREGASQAIVRTATVIEVEPPLPPPTPKPAPRVISKGPITSQALSLPKPAYPPLAKQLKIQGAVSVQVLIDENGRVLSAKTISGSAMLAVAAQQAALGARFSPTTLGGQAMKVSGVITYNFVLQ